MPPKFGTSGLRGLVVELTDQIVTDHVRAFLSVCDVGDTLFVGHDLRDSSPALAAVVTDAALDAGVNVVSCGALPTPALALAALNLGAGALMVTGSHIPADRNGLKFYTRMGEITKADETGILGALGQSAKGLVARNSEDLQATERYRDRFIAAFGSKALSGTRLGVYSHSAVGRDVMIEILQGVGAEVIELGRSNIFIPVDTEAVDAGTRAQLRNWAAEHGVDAILSTDGDSDRPLVTDATGTVVVGDVLGQITAALLGADVVVTPVSSNTGVDNGERFAEVIRTRIGSPFVIAAMEAKSGEKVVGYEANGGFLLGYDAKGPTGPLPALMTRDCMLPILGALFAARNGDGIDLAARVAQEPARFTAADRLENVPTERSQDLVARLNADSAVQDDLLGRLSLGRAVALDQTDGMRLTAESGTVIHIRPSGNAPELRLYVEAESPEQAFVTLETGLGVLRGMLGE
ncbi:phosphomannomutase [Puniceibacterium sediminis]|uniref:Phosphomannomutase n=1 Tax=Puniceibacterium sediminis TaxID=1608407 RepID=A0A238WL70_9RHOB|nr:phosphomannomutase [Puniceibacterium sediminis]SNR47310.1 phosphomannomutase [Puniceibacterium sediminis]